VLVPHDVVNVGNDTLKVAGFFFSSTLVSVFDDPIMPFGKRVVGALLLEEAGVESVPAGD
jgi:hypothetical protein